MSRQIVDSKGMDLRLREWGHWARQQQRDLASPSPTSTEPTALAAIMCRRIKAVDRAIACLNEKQRYVVEWHYRDGVSLRLLAQRKSWTANGIYMAYLRPAYRHIAAHLVSTAGRPASQRKADRSPVSPRRVN